MKMRELEPSRELVEAVRRAVDSGSAVRPSAALLEATGGGAGRRAERLLARARQLAVDENEE